MTWAIRLFELAIAQVELDDLRDRQRRTRRPDRETVSDPSQEPRLE